MHGTTVRIGNNQILRDEWTEFLSRYKWTSFTTMTFKNARKDVFELFKVFGMFVRRWCYQDAEAIGLASSYETEKKDGYGRSLGKNTRWRGPYDRKFRSKNATDIKKSHPVYVIAAEPHTSGNLHLHGLFREPGMLPDMRRDLAWDIWFNQMDIGRCRVEPPKSQGDVAAYCSKYVTKPEGVLQLSDSFDAACISSAIRGDQAQPVTLTRCPTRA